MKIVKRDGRIVEYDPNKIKIAIKKANNDVLDTDKINDKDIDKIILSIEKTKKKRLLVEDIQDLIEKKLVEMNKYELVKAYMLYRYERELIRKANKIDDSILTLIKNSNKVLLGNSTTKYPSIISHQRDLIAGEVSKDLTKRILLPEYIIKAHENGNIFFHDSDYFLQPMFNSSYINIKDMLENGTIVNNIILETPKSFHEACFELSEILLTIASNQYGDITINIKDISKYLYLSYKKIKNIKHLKSELINGIKVLIYQINTILSSNGKTPQIFIILELNELDYYLKYTEMIIQELLNQKYIGLKNENNNYINFNYPKLIYILNELNTFKNKKYNYLTELAIKCSKKRLNPIFISSKKINNNTYPLGYNFLTPYKNTKGKYVCEGRFNQGIVTINLPQIGILANHNEKIFFELLDERLEICYEALLRRYYSLLGIVSNVSPTLYQYGAISRLNKDELIDKLLKNGYSTLSLGYIGIYEMTIAMKDVSHLDPIGKKFALKVIKKMKETCIKWKKETNISFNLYGIPSISIGKRLLEIDREQFGTIKNITDKYNYEISFNIKEKNIYKKLLLEKEFQDLTKNGISFIDINNVFNYKKLINFIYDNNLFVELTDKNDIILEEEKYESFKD